MSVCSIALRTMGLLTYFGPGYFGNWGERRLPVTADTAPLCGRWKTAATSTGRILFPAFLCSPKASHCFRLVKFDARLVKYKYDARLLKDDASLAN